MAYRGITGYHKRNLLGRSAISATAIAAMLCLSAANAAAEGDKKKNVGSYWSVTFLGGVLSPQGAMADSHKAALATGMRISWTHKVGVGLELQGEYSPLPRRLGALAPLETYESHFAVATAGPRVSFGRGFARIWASAGGGVSYEHSTRKFRDEMGRPAETNSDDVVPVGVATTAVEFHIMKSGGLVIAGTYTKTFKTDLPRKYYALIGGLVFTFE